MTECDRIIKDGIVPASFIQEEIRCDFLVSAKMKKVWAIELDLLSKFQQICQENDLQFWAGFGTLLGAVRHQGFIPWDDDLDVWMPRDDYNKLLALNLKLENPYFFQTTLNDEDYYCSFARLRNSNTTGILVSKNNCCNNGIYIDIYPLDGIHKNNIKQWLISKYIRVVNIAAHAYMYNINPNPITRFLHHFLRLSFIRYDPKRTYKTVNKLASRISWNDSVKVGFVVFAPYEYEKNSYKREYFTETEWMTFENIKVPVPVGYHNILSILYGDYMQFPPAEIRGIWHKFIFEPDISYKEYKKTIDGLYV